MPSALDRNDYGPPHDAGAARAFGLALLIHAALIAALTWGVNWKHTDSEATFGAELWSNALPVAAPIRSAPPEAAPLPTPQPTPLPTPPRPVTRPVVQAPPEATPNVDIALEQEKKRQQLQDQKLAQEKAERDKAQLAKAEQLKTDRAKADKATAEKLKADKLKTEQLAKAEQAKADALKAKQAQQAADKQREDNLSRMMTNAGGAQGGSSTNRASVGGKGTSTTYGAIATAAVKPNVVFTEAFDGNPLAKVEVRLQLDGTIISSRVVQASGNDNWDKAVLNAVIRTGRMPKDVDGKLPDTILILEFKPRF